MASPIRTNESELKIAELLPVGEWFDLYSGIFPLGAGRVSIILKGFLCVTKKNERNRNRYYISSENKARLIERIKQNPKSKEFDITLDDEQRNNLWNKLLGVNQGVSHESTD